MHEKNTIDPLIDMITNIVFYTVKHGFFAYKTMLR